MTLVPDLLRLPVRWVAMHGVFGMAARRAARSGDPQAMLIADPATRADPQAVFDRMREQGPVVRSMVSYVSVDHETCSDVLRSDDFRTVSIGELLPTPLRRIEERTRTQDLHPVRKPSLLSVEPPEHTRYRTLVSSVFTARAVAGLRDQVQQRADALLDSLAERSSGPVDLVGQYCAQLPVAVICDILGVPESDRERVLRFGELAAPSLDMALPWKVFRDSERGLAEFDAWLSGHIEQLKRRPGDDLLSQLTRASTEGHKLDDLELRSTAGLVLAAGFETTVNLLGNGAWLLMQHPDQLARLREDPSLWSGAVDETLRLESPVQLTGRISKHDTVLAGTPVPAGHMVVTVLAAANRDPKVFPDPLSFDVGRRNAARHLAFSGGRHYCLGAALARAEGEVGLRSLFDRFPDIAPAGQGTRRKTRVLRGWATLPVQLGQPAAVEQPV